MAVEKWIVDAFNSKTELRMETASTVRNVRIITTSGRYPGAPVLAEEENGCLWSFGGEGKHRISSARLLPPDPPPLEFWVNEYKAGTGSNSRLHKTADEAKNAAYPEAIRVAVHMREVQDD